MTNTLLAPASTWPPSPRQLFYGVLLVTSLLKLWLAISVPIIGDEAYFYQWGTQVDWGGFYDHPPMVGWILWALQQVSSQPLVLRAPAILLWIAIAFGMMDLVQRLQPEQADKRWLLGSLFLSLPFTWCLNFITTDTPLIFFLFFSGYVFLRSALTDSWRGYALCGALLGLALLSKYFAGLLAIAYAVYLLPRRGGIARLALIAVCALPFMLLNLAWNASHCWNNILFNLINRNQGAQFSLSHVAVYVLMLVYLVTPWTGWRLCKALSQYWRREWRLLSLVLVPFALFLLLSFYKTIGLHWVLAFLPFVFLLAGLLLPSDTLKRHQTWALWLSLPHLIALALVVYWPSTQISSESLRANVVMHRSTPALWNWLKQDLPANGLIMTRSYSSAALLAYHGQQYVPVFGPGSFHARFDDNVTDFSKLEGKTLRIFTTRPLEPSSVLPYFDQVKFSEHEVDGARFYFAQGTGFHFQPYFEQVLRPAAERYYRIPAGLPVTGCRFLEQYGLLR